MQPERLVVFTGAGVSAESGIRTFRDHDGLWEEFRIEDVATPDAWAKDPETVLRFYDQRRAQILTARPNAAHRAIAAMEAEFHVDVITQNIDDLHERAGSSRVLHLHGEIMKARGTVNPEHMVDLNGPSLGIGDHCPLGSQLRPHIVWFGEEVPMMPKAAEIIAEADRILVVGTSLQVYPAAGLVHYAPSGATLVVIDPAELELRRPGVRYIKAKASEGVPQLAFEWGVKDPIG